MPHEANYVRDRFIAERGFIEQYVHFVQQAAQIPDHLVGEINERLSVHGLPELPARKDDRDEEIYSPGEMEALIKAIASIEPAVEQKLDELNKKHDAFLAKEFGEEQRDKLANEWTGWFEDHIAFDPGPEDVEESLKYAKYNAPENEGDEDDISRGELEEIIEEGCRRALEYKAKGRTADLEVAYDQLGPINLMARAAMPSAEINIMRQGFILLMTAFDAAIFDLFRIALRKKFFGLIGVLGKNEKVSLDHIGNFGSFEAFRDQIIEDQLRTRYLKDLLLLLNGQGVQCVDTAQPETFGHLIELVLRRNLHVHNRGVVDERYLERDDKGNPRFNVYNLSIGDLAGIDEPYWQIASRLCTDCVAAVASWSAT